MLFSGARVGATEKRRDSVSEGGLVAMIACHPSGRSALRRVYAQPLGRPSTRSPMMLC
jgi:hypothetical protein